MCTLKLTRASGNSCVSVCVCVWVVLCVCVFVCVRACVHSFMHATRMDSPCVHIVSVSLAVGEAQMMTTLIGVPCSDEGRPQLEQMEAETS